MANVGQTWTEDRIELLTKLWREGLSASQIAAELGGDVSRNSVLGKANRLELVRNEVKGAGTRRPRKPDRHKGLFYDRVPVTYRLVLNPLAQPRRSDPCSIGSTRSTMPGSG